VLHLVDVDDLQNGSIIGQSHAVAKTNLVHECLGSWRCGKGHVLGELLVYSTHLIVVDRPSLSWFSSNFFVAEILATSILDPWMLLFRLWSWLLGIYSYKISFKFG
jgi:hypothetical protein